MDADLKCNHLTCRKSLIDKGVVTTCSHIFCVECANELFNASRLCPACESPLTEPDDVVVCSLNPTNDYKTSVLSGLSPSIIMEICSRALSFWQYQIHQESSFQQAVTRNLNDKNAQLQKQLENVVREANGEISLLGNKIEELERDLELERRKMHELQDASREREKEYLKLKAQHDKVKRKALLGTDPNRPAVISGHNFNTLNRAQLDNPVSVRLAAPDVDVGAVVGGMQAIGIQRTPLVNRTSYPRQPPQHWSNGQSRAVLRSAPQPMISSDHPFRTASISDHSEGANEVESMLLPRHHGRDRAAQSGWGTGSSKAVPTQQRFFNPKSNVRPAR